MIMSTFTIPIEKKDIKATQNVSFFLRCHMLLKKTHEIANICCVEAYIIKGIVHVYIIYNISEREKKENV